MKVSECLTRMAMVPSTLLSLDTSSQVWVSSYLNNYNYIYVILIHEGEKLTDEEVDTLLQGVEDNQGQVNYEGQISLFNAH